MTLDSSFLKANADTTSLGGRKGILKNRNESVDESKRASVSSNTSTPAANGEPVDIPIKYGVYKTELVLLSKSNSSRYCRFIMDWHTRREEKLRVESLKFIECLRVIPEFEPLIEEGIEEAMVNGDEEVKFIKKDLTLASQLIGPAEYLAELIKFSITGNVK